MFLGSILCGSVAIYWARDFFRLWIGLPYSEPVGYPTVASLFYLLIVGSMVSVPQRIGYQVLFAVCKHKLLACLFMIEGASNLLLSLVLVRSYGLVGVALGTLIPAVMIQGFLQPIFVCRVLEISLGAYLRQVMLPPLLATMTVLPLLPLVLRLLSFDRPNSWAGLAVSGSMTCLLCLPVVVLLGLTSTSAIRYWSGL